MERRKFLRNGALLTGLGFIQPGEAFSSIKKEKSENGVAKNIIFMISDGMSTGTLNMANLLHRNLHGKHCNWIRLYEENLVQRALMDTASANSMVTDSAAASSAFGSGMRVNNGSLNIGTNGEALTPLWYKFKKAGKRIGCVTTVTATHATPAGLCVNSTKRNAEEDIALKYLELGIDVLMGGGDEFFNPTLRSDKKDVYSQYNKQQYQIVKDKHQLKNTNSGKVLGIFSKGALPYTIDHKNDDSYNNIPSLAEMTQKAIEVMKDNDKGFVLQVEAGKVDWAAHANDAAGLLYDQLAFDEAIGVATAFAEADGNTLVIITTDHGNANPGLIYGAQANDRFATVSSYTHTNEWVLNQINANFNIEQVKDLVYNTHKAKITDEEAGKILSYYTGLEKEDGLYNYRKVPFNYYAQVLKQHNNIGWISMDHSADYVELAMMGPGSELLQPFVKNTDLHNLVLQATAVTYKN